MFPYLKPHGIDGLEFKFHNQEAADWYDPLKPYTLLEYEWVRANVKLMPQTTVIDAGCHHGNYSVVFAPAFVIAVDNVIACCNYAKANMDLNGMKYQVTHTHLGAEGVKTNRKPAVYKVDIEGSEFELLPAEIDRFPSVHTWIVEIHPAHGIPDNIALSFDMRGFDLLKVDREAMKIRPYLIGEKWPGHATLIATRPGKATK